MTVFDLIAIIVAIGVFGACIILLLVLAWSMFEDTKLGEYFLEKLEKDEEE